MIEISRIIESINNRDEELFNSYLEESLIIIIKSSNGIVPINNDIALNDFSKLDNEIKKYRYNIYRRLSNDPSASNFLSLTKNYANAYLEETDVMMKIKLAFKMVMSYLSFVGLFSKLINTGDNFCNNLVKKWYMSRENIDSPLCSNCLKTEEINVIIKFLVETLVSISGNDKSVILGSANKLIKTTSDIIYNKKSKEIFDLYKNEKHDGFDLLK